jgi:hypothetical protein
VGSLLVPYLNRVQGVAFPSQALLAKLVWNGGEPCADPKLQKKRDEQRAETIRRGIQRLHERGHLEVTVVHGRNSRNNYRPVLKPEHALSITDERHPLRK